MTKKSLNFSYIFVKFLLVPLSRAILLNLAELKD
jgi:hypothetical protein